MSEIKNFELKLGNFVTLLIELKFDCSQVLVRNVPPDTDESVSESVEHFFLVNTDHYLTNQVCT